MKKKLPKLIYVYWQELGNDDPCLAATADIANIPDDADGAKVGFYALTEQKTFVVKRELKP